MKAATIKEIKYELASRSLADLREICLRLARFKKENKELLSYLLFESFDESAYIKNIKIEIDLQFDEINRNSYYYIKKSVRKILSATKKHIRYSQKKTTEADLLIYFSMKLSELKPSIHNNIALQNIYNRQVESIKKTVESLHEDLQFDYQNDLENLLKKVKKRR